MTRSKVFFIVIAGLLVCAAAYYLISPLFTSVEVNDDVPDNVISDSRSGAEALTSKEQDKLKEQMDDVADEGASMDDGMPTSVAASGERAEVQGTSGHPASGYVRVLRTADGPVIRYENFETINGPKLHLYLSKDLDATEYVDLGPVKATKGNINYHVPDDVNLGEYRYVMYWCKPFSVLFNYAEINPVS